MTKKSIASTAVLWARFRFSVVGSLLSAPPRRGRSRRHSTLGREDLDASGDGVRRRFRRRDD
jgi:hypothetical protein